MKALMSTLILPILIASGARICWATPHSLHSKPPRPEQGASKTVSFSQSAQRIDAYDYVEVTVSVSGAHAQNPFTGATLHGTFGKAGTAGRLSVDGFCDSADGSIFRIRFMPS